MKFTKKGRCNQFRNTLTNTFHGHGKDWLCNTFEFNECYILFNCFVSMLDYICWFNRKMFAGGSPVVILCLRDHKKAGTSRRIYQSKFNQICDDLSSCERIFTDCSSARGTFVAAAMSSSGKEKAIGLPDVKDPNTAELLGIELGLVMAEESVATDFLIVSDSLNTMQTLDCGNTENSDMQEVIDKIADLRKNKRIIFCWVPGHTGIAGNEAVDKLAKLAAERFMAMTTKWSSSQGRGPQWIHSLCQRAWHTCFHRSVSKIQPYRILFTSACNVKIALILNVNVT